jgi:lysine 2,3-aminomutase
MLELEHSNLDAWKESFSSAIKTTEQLASFLESPVEEVEYPLFIPISLAKKIKDQGPGGPLWKQFVPCADESGTNGLKDPIADHHYSKKGGIIHRYGNRLLFSPTEVCPVQCRYCFRKNELHTGDPVFKANTELLLEYLIENPTVEEVILTGGDPLVLSDQRIDKLLSEISTVSSVTMVRFHSRTPVVMPERLSQNLLNILSKHRDHFKAITLVIHTNHDSEIDDQFTKALRPYLAAGISLLSQSVLLRGVNDSVSALRALFQTLYFSGVRPYYLHHPDPVKGAMHFTLSLEQGRAIYRDLKASISGVMLPHYIIELPHGKGKTLAHSSQVSTSNDWYDKDGDIIHQAFKLSNS